MTGGYKGLCGGTEGYGGYSGLHKTCSVIRSSPDTFSWSILHKGVTGGDKGLQWVTGDYKGLQEVTG